MANVLYLLITLEQRWACNLLPTLKVLLPFENIMDVQIGFRKHCIGLFDLNDLQ